MTDYNIKKPCNVCNGAGVIYVWNAAVDEDRNFVDPVETSCPYCAGVGTVITSCVDLGDNIFESYVILEELDATEHNALTDTQKDGILHILACGKVDLNTGKAGRVRLWNWFGAESTTVANLTALLE